MQLPYTKLECQAGYLEQQAVDHDQVTNTEVALGNAISSEHHGGCKSPTEDDVLP